MTDVTLSLAESLYGADEESMILAGQLLVKAVGDRAPVPEWHPAHPSHPLHDLHNDYAESTGGRFWEHEHLRGKPDADFFGTPIHPPHLDREAATQRARDAINQFAHPLVAQHLHDRLSGNQALGGEPSIDPLHPASPLHDYYLANPRYYHDRANHDLVRSTTEGQISTELYYAARKPSHPLNPDHPDRDHFLASHARGHDLGRPDSAYFVMHGSGQEPGYTGFR